MLHEAHKRRNFQLSDTGAVLGIDIGWAADDETTSVCLLSWTHDSISIKFSENMRFAFNDIDDAKAIAKSAREMAGEKLPLMIAIDGMVMPDLTAAPSEWREAERCLSRGEFAVLGQPGRADDQLRGQRLAAQASLIARVVAEIFNCSRSTDLIHGPIIEAFPNAFLATLLDDNRRETAFRAIAVQKQINSIRRMRRRGRRDGMSETEINGLTLQIKSLREHSGLRRDLVKSDFYYELLTQSEGSNTLLKLIERLLPERSCSFDWAKCQDHDQRASLVCALTALCVAAKQFCHVGDLDKGIIVLPPRKADNAAGLTDWAEEALRDLRGPIDSLKSLKKVPQPSSDQWVWLAFEFLNVFRDILDRKLPNTWKLREKLRRLGLAPEAALQIAVHYCHFSKEHHLDFEKCLGITEHIDNIKDTVKNIET